MYPDYCLKMIRQSTLAAAKCILILLMKQNCLKITRKDK